jgi:hypothetical protein
LRTSRRSRPGPDAVESTQFLRRGWRQGRASSAMRSCSHGRGGRDPNAHVPVYDAGTRFRE